MYLYFCPLCLNFQDRQTSVTAKNKCFTVFKPSYICQQSTDLPKKALLTASSMQTMNKYYKITFSHLLSLRLPLELPFVLELPVNHSFHQHLLVPWGRFLHALPVKCKYQNKCAILLFFHFNPLLIY